MEYVRILCVWQKLLETGILDEIQCGMGRTGSMFAWQDYGVRPDIMCMAKAIGNGVPVGAFAMTEEVAEYSLKPGDHGTTYGGNPFACAAVDKVLDIFEKDHIVEHVKELTPYLEEKLDELVEKYDGVLKRRGKGLMQGLVLARPVGEVIANAQKEGLLVISGKIRRSTKKTWKRFDAGSCSCASGRRSHCQCAKRGAACHISRW